MDFKKEALKFCPNTLLPNHGFLCQCESFARVLSEAYAAGRREATEEIYQKLSDRWAYHGATVPAILKWLKALASPAPKETA
jgi:hypothetical protein